MFVPARGMSRRPLFGTTWDNMGNYGRQRESALRCACSVLFAAHVNGLWGVAQSQLREWSGIATYATTILVPFLWMEQGIEQLENGNGDGMLEAQMTSASAVVR